MGHLLGRRAPYVGLLVVLHSSLFVAGCTAENPNAGAEADGNGRADLPSLLDFSAATDAAHGSGDGSLGGADGGLAEDAGPPDAAPPDGSPPDGSPGEASIPDGDATGDAADANLGIRDGDVDLQGALDAFAADGINLSCGALGQVCVNGAGCCSGLCDPVAKVCIAPPNVCAAIGAVCVVPTDCCSVRCTAGKCASQCAPNGSVCGAAADCCSGNCAAGTCAAVVVGGCRTLGNPCVANGGCCSQNCQGGLCAPQGGGCNAIGDVCFQNTDCCSGACTIPVGGVGGTCTAVNGGGGGNCTQDGEPCLGCGNCCSRVCAPTLTGGHVCAPASGCKVIGDICHQTSDCCGGGNTMLPGANSVTCNIIAGTNPPIGTCSNPNGCDPDGDVCGLQVGNACGNSRHDCCNCLPPKINCCKIDKAGVPRCYGGSTQMCPSGYTGQPPCCIAVGEICAFSNECCNGAPCVPDANGQLRCGAGCEPVGGPCTADSDCCAGEPCVIPRGQLFGTCGAPPPPPPPPPDLLPPPDLYAPPPDLYAPPPADMAAPPPDLTGQPPMDLTAPRLDLTAPPPDLKPLPDLAPPPPPPCSLVGQSCSTLQPCCSGLVCTPPTGLGVCVPGELDCTCIPGIF